MDPFFPLVFGFILLLVLLVGGFIVVFPVTRRLGDYLEMQLEKRREGADPVKLEQLQRELGDLSEQLRLLAERQSFTDALLADRTETPKLPERTVSPDAGTRRPTDR